MKAETIADHCARHRFDTIIETGLDNGRGSGMGLTNTYVALDWGRPNVDRARAAGYDARHGDSGTLLPDILAGLDRPALFWLDAHGIDCNRPAAGAFPGWPAIPLLRELEAVAAWEHAAESVVLIDDMPVMAHWVSVGLGGAADMLAFDEFLDRLPVRWDRSMAGGIMRLEPAT